MRTQRTHSTRRVAVTGIGAALALSLVATLPTAQAASAAPAQGLSTTLTNPSFENGLDGWTSTATVGAPRIESAGVDGGSRLTHWLESA